METLDTLFTTTEQENIAVMYKTMPDSHLGLYIAGHGWPLIVLDKSLRMNRLLHKCILAEELGHHFTSAGNTVYQSAGGKFWLNQLTKTEAKALRWSAFRLAPDERLLGAIKAGADSEHELAEELDITTELLLYRLKLYKIKPPSPKSILSLKKHMSSNGCFE